MPSTPQASVLRPHSLIIVTSGDGKETVTDCLQCVHCQKVMRVVRGSGRKRGFCFKCMGPTCGTEACQSCVPVEKGLEIEEKAFAEVARSIMGNFVPGASGLMVPK
jgi:hypothetical protein